MIVEIAVQSVFLPIPVGKHLKDKIITPSKNPYDLPMWIVPKTIKMKGFSKIVNGY